ncbi:MAG TPA: FG-GAP-like repeat-containing protein [Silvibacterium sp.]|nr:FG-GAP-like repeat-containing protein [Silvibacterium sp.]
MKHSLSRPVTAAIASLFVSVALFAGCHSRSGLPDPASKTYAELVSDFYVGLSALQVGDDVGAQSSLAQAAQLAPGEPASWANWGILALRQRNFDPAAERLNRAAQLAPKNGQMYYLLGLLGSARGDSQYAVTNFRKAVSLDPKNLRASYALALEVERQGAAGSEEDFQRLIQQILTAQPDNLAALLELSRISAKRGDVATLRATIDRIGMQSSAWPGDVKEQFAELQSAASSTNPRTAATRSIFLRNVLMQVPAFRASLSDIKPQPGDEAQPFTHFLRLPSPSSTPAPADTALTFSPQPVANAGNARWSWIGAVSLTGEGAPTIVTANAHQVQLASGASFPFPGGSSATDPSPEGILPLDFNYDFKTDLVLAGAGGVRFMRQDGPAKFTDVTAPTKLPAAVLNASYTGAWAVDIEADGDLDIVMGQSSEPPTVLRNNGDGTFTPIHPFSGVSGIRQFVWADFNGDGNPDAALIDGTGHLHVFFNQRSGTFVEKAVPAEFNSAKAIAAADVNNDGLLDIVAVLPSSAIARLSSANGGQSWSAADIANVPNPAATLVGEVRLRAADIDNNGAIDLLLAQVSPANGRAAGGQIWLADQSNHFNLLDRSVGPPRVFDLADVHADGHLALLGLTSDGQQQVDVSHGTKDYHWQIIRPRARLSTGDQRINSFGIGGEIEIRSALLTQKLPITGAQLHFGLGEHTSSDVARIVWPNGSVRAEFALKADQEVLTEQRLKGSCPFLFAWNGKEMSFVKDAVPWGSAIGLRINSLGTASIAATQEWYKIRGDQLVPHNGYYDLRITGELWETYYYDYLTLMVVDHPAGTDIFTDERFVIPPPKLAITAVSTPHAIVRAVDDNGHDVTETLRALDGVYLDNFGRGQYQGVTRDHYVEIDLGNNLPASGPLYLIAKGWLHPSDSTINVAISQGNHEQPKPLSLEVEDAPGVWRLAKPNLGFPAGRNKICLIDLTGVFRPGAPHRVRLSTNLEIYWDQIQWAQGTPNTPLRITRLDADAANLHYRGYSVVHQANASSPEIPDYNKFLSTTQIWHDLSGYYTRYGDVRELLQNIDDRYVIMNAGDEMRLRFPAPAPPPSGWVRDYVIAGDGWIKDGDYNSTYSATVQPLPYHARKLYNTPPGKLEDEWVYREHPKDWQTYQTRYVSSDDFANVLRSSANQ